MGIRNGLDTVPSGGGTAKTVQSSLQTYCLSLFTNLPQNANSINSKTEPISLNF